MPKTNFRFFIILFGYIFISFILFLYSYTQVDLNMTLSQASIWQMIQKGFQYIGFYQRPLSTILFIIIISSLYSLYIYLIHLTKHQKITSFEIKTILIAMTAILLFAYPAFSYDFFNYMFTAKTVLIYHQNPYVVKPLDFSGLEPWLTFMRWTHLPSAYTPVWILVSLIPYVFGFGYFLITLLNFKIVLGVFYLITAWGIYRILELQDKEKSLMGLVIFAFNPLVIIESLMSPHNDIMMMALAVLAMYFYFRKKTLLSYLFLAFSVAIKMMTIFLYPVAFTGWKRKYAFYFMVLAVGIGFWKKELLPWYFLWLLPYMALFNDIPVIVTSLNAISFGLLLRYAPYLYFGDYNPRMLMWRNIATFIPLLGVGLYSLIRKIKFTPFKN